MIKRVAYLARFGRVGMAPLTISVPIMGALTLGEPLPCVGLLGLGGLGLCAHLFGFGLNDIIDYPLDRTISKRQGHPLVTGKLTRLQAWAFTLLQVPLALGIYRFLLQGSNVGLGILCLSILLSAVYNLWSKWGSIPRLLPELALAVSIGLLSLSATLLSNGATSPRSLIFAFSLTLLLLLVNSGPSGLKDLKTDAAFGAKSFVLSTGSRMLDEDRMLVSRVLWLYSTVLQLMLLICMLVLIILFRPPWLIAALVCILGIYAALHLRMLLAIRSFTALRRSMPLLNGYYNYGALSLLVVRWMPIGLQLFYSLLILALLLIPWRLSFRIWRNRYAEVPLIPRSHPHLHQPPLHSSTQRSSGDDGFGQLPDETPTITRFPFYR